MSTIAAGTTSGTALVSTGDTSGQLVLQTNGTTTAVTIGTNQIVTLAQPLPVASGGTGATSLSSITAGTATNLAGGAQGSVPYQSAAGTTALLAAGTSGQVLTTQGAGANPTWTTPSGGSMVYLTQATASNASTVNFSNLFSSTYETYVVIGTNVRAADTTNLYLQSGGSYRTNNYYGGYVQYPSNSTTVNWSNVSNSFAPWLFGGSSSGSLVFYISNVNDTSYYKNFFGEAVYWDGTITKWQFTQGQWRGGTGAVTGFQFSGTGIYGTFSVYGIKTS